MAVHMQSLFMNTLQDLRVHPVDKWIRASAGGTTIVDSKRAKVVWEPRRVVPSYAVPVADLEGELVPYAGDAGTEMPVRLDQDSPVVLDPRTPFTVHSCPGVALTICTAEHDLAGAAFAPDDADLDGYVVLDWDAFEEWHEEDERVIGHPHDPFDRIDCLRSSRHVVISLDGQVLADTTRATLLFETPLGMRYYLPREDVRMDLLGPSAQQSICAYKGVASYWSVGTGGEEATDIAWGYEHPLHDALPVRDLVCFFTERVDLTVDGEEIPRPVTPWS